MKKFTKTHEWIEVDGETATIGISDFAQKELSDVVYVELPEIEKKLEKGESFMIVESVKVASDINAPVNGEVIEVNSLLEDEPEKVNESAEADAWFVKIKLSDPKEVDDLLDENSYKEYTLSEK